MASSSSSGGTKIMSGPIETDLLYLQHKHVSKAVWNGADTRVLKVRRAVPTHHGIEEIPQQITQKLEEAGFYWVCKLSYLNINNGLIMAMVERWRPETHTFHMRCGECTITLQDIAIITGLCVDGLPLVGATCLSWSDLCEDLLGVRPADEDLIGSGVKLSWLASIFSDVNDYVGNDDDLNRFTRAWILRFIGGALFVDKTGNRVSLRYLQFLRDFKECNNYAWGAVVLGFLYRELCYATDYKCKSIGGMCLLLQLWAWERLIPFAPRRIPTQLEGTPLGHRWVRRGNSHIGYDDVKKFRQKLDTLKRNEFIWLPYTEEVLSHLPTVCNHGERCWTAVVPLICFHIAEWHQPDRVMRQFGFQQHIPQTPLQPHNLHGLTLKGKMEQNWPQLLMPAIELWNNRVQQQVPHQIPQHGQLSFNSDYMVWYRKKTKMFIDPSNARVATLGEVAETLQFMVSPEGRNTWTVDDLVPYVDKITMLSNEEERVIQAASQGPTADDELEVPPFNILPDSRETQGLGRRRQDIQPEEYDFPQMPPREHGLYYTPEVFTQYPSQLSSMYSYPHVDHDSGEMGGGNTSHSVPMFSYSDLFGSSPTTPIQHGYQPASGDIPSGPPYVVPGQIPRFEDIVGIDLRSDFAGVADSRDDQQQRRNPDRRARRWDRPCGTSSAHHHHQR